MKNDIVEIIGVYHLEKEYIKLGFCKIVNKPVKCGREPCQNAVFRPIIESKICCQKLEKLKKCRVFQHLTIFNG